jgi:hypothetical protein
METLSTYESTRHYNQEHHQVTFIFAASRSRDRSACSQCVCYGRQNGKPLSSRWLYVQSAVSWLSGRTCVRLLWVCSVSSAWCHETLASCVHAHWNDSEVLRILRRHRRIQHLHVVSQFCCWLLIWPRFCSKFRCSCKVKNVFVEGVAVSFLPSNKWIDVTECDWLENRFRRSVGETNTSVNRTVL